MKAAIINQFGGTEVFKITNIDKPGLNSDQLLVKVKATSINPIDWKQRNGNHKFILGSSFPIVLGYDICGEVVDVGSVIKNFKKGDFVFGVLDNKYGGALAEYAVGHENCFAMKPGKLTIEEAAAFPMVALTALQALRDKADLKPGQTVLINGASGGVGHIAVQIAKLMGAKIIAVAGNQSRDFMNQFNPDEFLDYTQQNITELNFKINVFFDVIGNLTFAKTKHLLFPGGIYLNLNYLHSLTKMPVNIVHQLFSNGKRAKSMLMKHSSSDLQQIARWIEEDKLKICIDRTFTLDQISDAHKYAQQGHNKGKNIIVISN